MTRRIPVLFLSLMLLQASLVFAQRNPEPFGIVSMRVTSQAFDPILPWNKNSEESIRGNALVLEGRKLLTSADLVKNANLLEVRKFGRYPDYPARPVRVDYDLNLALLEVDDPAFWEGLRPLPLTGKPVISGQFSINRWRSNGRFEQGSAEVVDFLVSTSPFGLMEFPMMRGTTAMGGLGWAEVLTHEGKITGIITSHGQQNFNAVNTDIIRLFARAGRGGQGNTPEPSKFAHRGFAWQRLNQNDLRDIFGLKGDDTGILIRKIFPGGTGSKELRPGDILHKINGYAIDPEGKIDHPSYGLMLFSAALNETLAPTLEVEIQRDGKRMKLPLERTRFSTDNYRIEPPRFETAQDFAVFGGLVVVELSLNYLRAWGKEWQDKAPARLVIEYSLNSLRDKGKKPERVLIVSRVLPDPSNLGYEDVANTMLHRINGREVHSLEEFREAIRHPQGGYHLIDPMPGQGRGRLVYSADEMDAINARVAERYGIP